MSKAQLAIDSMVTEKERELNNFIQNNRNILIPFAGLKLQLKELKEKQKQIAANRLADLLKIDANGKRK